MTLPHPSRPAAAPIPRTVLVIDRNAMRGAAARRELAHMPWIEVLDVATNTAEGMVRSARLKPDCILLGWESDESIMRSLVTMLKQFKPDRPLVLLAGTDEDIALARQRRLPVEGILLPGQLPADLANAIGRGAVAPSTPPRPESNIRVSPMLRRGIGR